MKLSVSGCQREPEPELECKGSIVVHTARRYYRLNGLVSPPDWELGAGNSTEFSRSWANLVI
jgi:hypothetical protein